MTSIARRASPIRTNAGGKLPVYIVYAIWVECIGSLKGGNRRVKLTPEHQAKSERRMGFGQIGVELDGFAREPVSLIKRTGTEKVAIHVIVPTSNVSKRQDGIGPCTIGVNCERLLQEMPRFVKSVKCERSVERVKKNISRLQVAVIGLPAAGRPGARALSFGHSHMRSKYRNDCAHYLVLDGKDIFERAVVVFGPAMCSRYRIDQLR